jgi:hypothetical protein
MALASPFRSRPETSMGDHLRIDTPFRKTTRATAAMPGQPEAETSMRPSTLKAISGGGCRDCKGGAPLTKNQVNRSDD